MRWSLYGTGLSPAEESRFSVGYQDLERGEGVPRVQTPNKVLRKPVPIPRDDNDRELPAPPPPPPKDAKNRPGLVRPSPRERAISFSGARPFSWSRGLSFRRIRPGPDADNADILGRSRNPESLSAEDFNNIIHQLQLRQARLQGAGFGFPGAEGEEIDAVLDIRPRAGSDTVSTDSTKVEEEIDNDEKNLKEEVFLEEKQQVKRRNKKVILRIRERYPQPIAEFLAVSPLGLIQLDGIADLESQKTFIATFIGLCANLCHATSNSMYGNRETECWAWGLGAMTGIYLAGGVSGAHLNPAISITLAVFRGFPWSRCLAYIIAQVLGTTAAGGLAWGLFRDAILHADPGLTAEITGRAIYTLPQEYVGVTTAFFSELVTTAILVCVVFALGDDRNSPPGAGMNALILGMVVSILLMAMGLNTGPCLNPARDIGPRLVAYLVGYGKETFTSGWWAYGAIAGPIAGALTGAALYDASIFVEGETPVQNSVAPRHQMVVKMSRAIHPKRRR